jgi:hypothetical protein
MNGVITFGSGTTRYNRIMNGTTRILLLMVLSLVVAIAVPVIVTASTV